MGRGRGGASMGGGASMRGGAMRIGGGGVSMGGGAVASEMRLDGVGNRIGNGCLHLTSLQNVPAVRITAGMSIFLELASDDIVAMNPM